jgi:hypothetical protein
MPYTTDYEDFSTHVEVLGENLNKATGKWFWNYTR